MTSTYHGFYRASTATITGCVKEFASIGQPSLQFPPQVSYYCDLCKTEHGFRFVRSVSVATPRQQLAFDEYCKSHFIEREVQVQ